MICLGNTGEEKWGEAERTLRCLHLGLVPSRHSCLKSPKYLVDPFIITKSPIQTATGSSGRTEPKRLMVWESDP